MARQTLSGQMVKVDMGNTSAGLGRIDNNKMYGPGIRLVPIELARALGKRIVVDGPSRPQDKDELPDDFPAVELLREEGYQTYGHVRGESDEDIIAIKGIGPVILSEIRAAQG